MKEIPEQTPLFRAIQSERYARQEEIRNIEKITKRRLIVYITNIRHPAGGINRDDIPPFADILHDIENVDVDLMIHSAGGDIDVAEKIVYMCRKKAKGLRVVVPECAKSAATLIALAAEVIVMGYTSELGPIDPQIIITTPDGKTISRPAKSFLDGLDKIRKEVEEQGKLPVIYYPLLSQLDPALIDFCDKVIERSKQFAFKWLSKYMCKHNQAKAKEIAERLSDVNTYLTHGTVIDNDEAKQLGLKVEVLEPKNSLWEHFWRLYCKYEISIRTHKLLKIFESSKVSISLS